jgi:hypothetical protein
MRHVHARYLHHQHASLVTVCEDALPICHDGRNNWEEPQRAGDGRMGMHKHTNEISASRLVKRGFWTQRLKTHRLGDRGKRQDSVQKVAEANVEKVLPG